MSPRAKLIAWTALLTLLTAAFCGVVVALLWHRLDGSASGLLLARLQEDAGLLVLLLGFYGVALGGLVKGWLDDYISGARALAAEAEVIVGANPAHRARLPEAAELQQLGAVINRMAEKCQLLLADEEEKLRAANARTQEEKNRLAALMSEFTQGVLVCNLDGQILLYNTRARQLLAPAEGSAGHALVGLGRSVFSLLDRQVLSHALDSLQEQLSSSGAVRVTQLVTARSDGGLVRVQMAPVLDAQRAISGYVLALEDVTRLVEESSARDGLLLELLVRARAALGVMRAAAENLLHFPGMTPVQQARFVRMVHEETLVLGGRVETASQAFAERARDSLPLQDMTAQELLLSLQRRIEGAGLARVRLEPDGGALWLKADGYGLSQAVLHLARRLCQVLGVQALDLRATRSGASAHLDLLWRGPPLLAGQLALWEAETCDGAAPPACTLRAMLERHAAECWQGLDSALGRPYVRLALPAGAETRHWIAPQAEDSRPEFYDFDLFNRPGQDTALHDRPLSELAYTVFDTETTGLKPSEGDEIISIGAVRIVNSRLLRFESFEQLIDPQRGLSAASIEVHGITPDMLAGQPVMGEVLPRFHAFAEGTVLLAHNAAFDMRFLQMKEASTGIRFDHPVLDTLLLSAVLHPDLKQHSLEAIAGRLGINVIGRHTAFGDALVTGEVFLRLLPLLAGRGIRTLRQALETSQQTYLARLQY
jgi:DNA polymerase-3 subunit epsilon